MKKKILMLFLALALAIPGANVSASSYGYTISDDEKEMFGYIDSQGNIQYPDSSMESEYSCVYDEANDIGYFWVFNMVYLDDKYIGGEHTMSEIVMDRHTIVDKSFVYGMYEELQDATFDHLEINDIAIDGQAGELKDYYNGKPIKVSFYFYSNDFVPSNDSSSNAATYVPNGEGVWNDFYDIITENGVTGIRPDDGTDAFWVLLPDDFYDNASLVSNYVGNSNEMGVTYTYVLGDNLLVYKDKQIGSSLNLYATSSYDKGKVGIKEDEKNVVIHDGMNDKKYWNEAESYTYQIPLSSLKELGYDSWFVSNDTSFKVYQDGQSSIVNLPQLCAVKNGKIYGLGISTNTYYVPQFKYPSYNFTKDDMEMNYKYWVSIEDDCIYYVKYRPTRTGWKDSSLINLKPTLLEDIPNDVPEDIDTPNDKPGDDTPDDSKKKIDEVDYNMSRTIVMVSIPSILLLAAFVFRKKLFLLIAPKEEWIPLYGIWTSFDTLKFSDMENNKIDSSYEESLAKYMFCDKDATIIELDTNEDMVNKLQNEEISFSDFKSFLVNSNYITYIKKGYTMDIINEDGTNITVELTQDNFNELVNVNQIVIFSYKGQEIYRFSTKA